MSHDVKGTDLKCEERIRILEHKLELAKEFSERILARSREMDKVIESLINAEHLK